jgi:glycerol kinase
VGPAAGVIRRAAAPTPTLRPATGRVEHPPRELLGVVLGLLEQVAAAGGPAPVAAAIASQRSTALWTTRELAPVSAAVSWRDRRGEAVVARLEPERDRLEAAAGLPLAPAWSGILGRALVDEGLDPADHLLLPLGAFVAARLTGSPPVVDPTLANRTFLLGAGAAGWSAELAGALELPLAALPPLAPTVHPYGELRWPGGGTVPLLAVAGDQQCAYVGAAGPTGRRLVANVGTAAFVMRLATAAETIPPQARQGPLWTSARRPRGPGRLVELPVLAPEDELAAASPAGADDSARAVARAVAMGDQRPASFAAAVAAAARRLRGAPDQALLLAGGALASPQLVHLVETALDLPLFRAGEPELTLIGAARLAAAGARLPWAYAAAGGARGSSS